MTGTSRFSLFLLAAVAAAQPSLAPPELGLFYDPAARGIRIITGVPGAALLEDPVAGGAIESAGVAPAGRYAIAVEGGRVRLLRRDGSSEELDVPPGRIAFSPSGASVAVHATGEIKVWTGLPARAEAVMSLPLDAHIGVLAVSDDGRSVAYAEAEGLFDATSAGPRMVAAGGEWSAVSFLRGGSDFAAADRSSDRVFLVRNGRPAMAAGPGEGVAEPVAVAFSADNTRLAVASARSGSVIFLNLETGETVETPCGCRPDGLHPLRGNAVFRLVDSLKSPLVMFDGDAAEPRVVRIAGGEQ